MINNDNGLLSMEVNCKVAEFKSEVTSLYRVMTLEQFIDMIINKHNILVLPSCWEDPYEKILGTDKDSIAKGTFSEQRWYGQCWSIAEENDGIWRAMTKNKTCRCVKIKVSIENLVQSIKESGEYDVDFSLNLATYSDAEDKLGILKAAQKLTDLSRKESSYEEIRKNVEEMLLLIKRQPFRYEEEVRLLAYHRERPPMCGGVPDKAWSYIFDYNKFIDEIVLDPWTPKYYLQTYKELLKRLGVKDAERKVTISSLYEQIDKKYLETHSNII